jgi:hypothetical protein
MARLTVVGMLLSVVLSGTVFAQPEPWMKQGEPNSLGLWLFVGDQCPATEEEVRERVDGEFLRARVKSDRSLDSLHLSVQVSCLSDTLQNGRQIGYTVSVEIRFGNTFGNDLMLYHFPDYSTILALGTGDVSEQFFLTAIRDKAAAALTDYLKANLE